MVLPGLQCARWTEVDVAKSGHGHSGHEALVGVHRDNGVLVIALSSFSVLLRHILRRAFYPFLRTHSSMFSLRESGCHLS